jgi:hypothetical protein
VERRSVPHRRSRPRTAPATARVTREPGGSHGTGRRGSSFVQGVRFQILRRVFLFLATSPLRSPAWPQKRAQQYRKLVRSRGRQPRTMRGTCNAIRDTMNQALPRSRGTGGVLGFSLLKPVVIGLLEYERPAVLKAA